MGVVQGELQWVGGADGCGLSVCRQVVPVMSRPLVLSGSPRECVCVCVWEREVGRWRERESDRERELGRDREREREGGGERGREIEIHPSCLHRCVSDVRQGVQPLLYHVTSVRGLSGIRTAIHLLLAQVYTYLQ